MRKSMLLNRTTRTFLAISAVLLIVVTYLGGWEYRWRELAMLAGILTLLVVILFVLLLRMQFTIGPSAWS